jgi:hypothetical protein
MLIDGNKMIEILGLPEWDDRVLDILEEFGEERPVLDDDKDIFTIWMKPERYGIELMFDENCKLNQYKDIGFTGSAYLNQISFDEDTTMQLPFGIKIGDSKEIIEKKIGQTAYALNEYNDLHWLLDDGEKKYFINCSFEDDTQEKLDSLMLDLFNEEIKYELTIL